LYRFCRATAEWKERALGEARILKHKETEWVRFLMRMEKTEKISANHNIVTGKGKTLCCQLEPHMDSKKAFMWSAVDSVILFQLFKSVHVRNNSFSAS
jgi:Ran-binding protein 1